MEEYLELQQLVYRVSEAIREEVGAERMYIYSFGSNQGNSHAHWHVVPLPPGVPYEEQQGAWVSWSKGVLRIPKEEMASLAERIGRRVERIYPAKGPTSELRRITLPRTPLNGVRHPRFLGRLVAWPR